MSKGDAINSKVDINRANGQPYAPIRVPRTQRLLRDRQTFTHWVQWVTSIVWVIGLLYALAVRHVGEFTVEYRFLAVSALMLMLVVYQATGVFRRFGAPGVVLLRLTRAWMIVLGGLLAVAFVTKSSTQYSRLVVGTWAVGALAGQFMLYLVAQWFSELWQRRMQLNLPALVVGSGHVAWHLADSINRNPFMPDHVVGVVDDPRHAVDWTHPSVPVAGRIDELPRLLESLEIDRVYVALPIERSGEIVDVQRMVLEHNVDVIWAPDIFSFNLLNHCVREVAGVPLISLSESPLTSGGRPFMKSLMDVTISAATLLFFSPLLLVIALAIKLTSKGPVIFKQRRHGWDGGVFEVWKFRTMYQHNEESGRVTQARKDDARVTPVGRILRRTSLDELPQLINVLMGTMSLVGPRPHAVVHNLEYSEQISAYMARHRVKPGITGWAQVHGYRGETTTVDRMVERVRLDLEYINSWSLSLDLWILIRTPFALFSKNAY